VPRAHPRSRAQAHPHHARPLTALNQAVRSAFGFFLAITKSLRAAGAGGACPAPNSELRSGSRSGRWRKMLGWHSVCAEYGELRHDGGVEQLKVDWSGVRACAAHPSHSSTQDDQSKSPRASPGLILRPVNAAIGRRYTATPDGNFRKRLPSRDGLECRRCTPIPAGCCIRLRNYRQNCWSSPGSRGRPIATSTVHQYARCCKSGKTARRAADLRSLFPWRYHRQRNLQSLECPLQRPRTANSAGHPQSHLPHLRP
jgi:hypothetical protein